jgi:glycosyltransferase involved in cell wall biosynthesis
MLARRSVQGSRELVFESGCDISTRLGTGGEDVRGAAALRPRRRIVDLTAVILSAALLPVYIALRRVFFDLPLHIDTSFYVSNHTICTRTIRYSRGWNARFAGCSKVLPEYFYSAVYLLHGGEGYKRASRLYLSLLNYGTGILVGLVASSLAAGDSSAYLLGLGLYLLISSEPQYGIYFENAEAFELPFQVLGAWLLFVGLSRESSFLVGAGIGVWAVESFFVKLSSLASTVVLAFVAAFLVPRSIGPCAVLLLAASVLWGVWVLANGARIARLVGPLAAHEEFFWKWAGTWRERIRKKLAFAGHIMMQRPVIPGLALLGATFGEGPGWFFALYAVAVAVAYAIQAGQIWYYLIPFLPLLSWLAVFGCRWCLEQGALGVAFIGGLFGIWLAQHGASVIRRWSSGGLRALNDHVWRVHGAAYAQMGETNLALEENRKALRREVGAKSLFVFGMSNQAYVLLDASYDTSLVSAAPWLDVMAPGWNTELNQQLVSSPPAYLLETESSLSDAGLREDLGLGYEVVAEKPGTFRLLRFTGRVGDPSRARLDARLYRSDVWVQASGIGESGAFAFVRRIRRRVGTFFSPKLGLLLQYPPRPLPRLRHDTDPRQLAPLPRISIVTPSPNKAAYLERTIRSVLDQNYAALEYIVADGGSSDETVAILERYRGALHSCESAPDRGPAMALNRAFARSSGEIMAWLDSGDLLLPKALHTVAAFLVSHPQVDVVYGHRVVIDERDLEVGRWVLPPHDDEALTWADFIPQESLFWRRRIWERVGGAFDESFQFALDWDLILRFRAAGARFARIPRFLGAFRIYSEQTTDAHVETDGHPEVARLRERYHGRVVSKGEIDARLRPYLRRHLLYHKLSRLGFLPP